MQAAKKEGGGLIRGTEKSDRAGSGAPAEIEVRARAVLLSGDCAEPQAAGALPTGNTRYGSRHLAEGRTKNSAAPIIAAERHSDRGLFNAHAI